MTTLGERIERDQLLAEVKERAWQSKRRGQRLDLEAHLRAQRDNSIVAAETLASMDNQTDAAEIGIDQALEDAERAERQLRMLNPVRSVEVRAEPLTYHEGGRHSFVRDTLAYNFKNEDEARERLERHGAEMAVELRARDQKAQREARRLGETIDATFEKRVNPNPTAGQGLSFAPPLWLIDQFASTPRPERVLANLIPNAYDLPAGVSSINVPRMTASTVVQPTSPLSAVPDQDVTDTSLVSTVQTFAGMVDCSLQLLEQSPPDASFDLVVYRDAMAAADAQLETQLITGTGTGAQLLGLLNISGITAVTYTAGSPTGTAMFPYFGNVFAQVSDARDLPPEAWLMRGARYVWLATSEDQQNRPLETPDPGTPGIGSLVGTPIYLDGAIPATLGGVGGTQDAVLAVRPSDFLLWEGTPVLEVFREPLAGSLGARIRVRKYAAAILGRYPSGIGTLTGTGLTVQNGE